MKFCYKCTKKYSALGLTGPYAIVKRLKYIKKNS